MAVLLASVLTGLFGTVMRSPTTPVCRQGQSCSAPAAGVRLAFMRRGFVVKSVLTSSTGRYRILLQPGTYTVRLATKSLPQHISPLTVVVPQGAVTRRNFVLDTGIR